MHILASLCDTPSHCTRVNPFTVNTSWVDEQGGVQVDAKQFAHTVLVIQLQVV